MQWPLGELPQDLLRIALGTLHARARHDDAEMQSRAIIAERSLRLRFDAERGRLALLRRLVDALPDPAAALDPLQAGPALFLTALARAMGAPREDAALLTAPSHIARLALVLRAAGLEGDTVRQHVGVFHPEALVPAALGAVSARSGAAPGQRRAGHLILAMADPIRARCDAADTLVAADEALARLHVAAGGTLPGVLAVPALLALVRQVRASGLAQTRPVLAMDGDCPISFHAHAAPGGRGRAGPAPLAPCLAAR
jgi:hypothetical protein